MTSSRILQLGIRAGRGRTSGLGAGLADAVVVGGGIGAVRAAAALRAAGRSVVLVQEGADVAGLAHPDIPVGTGFECFESVPADWRAIRGMTTGLCVGGAVRALPLSRGVLPTLLPTLQVVSALAEWGRTRVSSELARLIGGGHEQRSYRDWVVQHYGEPLFARLFEPYCERRFGEASGVSANVARAVHGASAGGVFASPSGGRARELALLLEGVEVVCGADVVGLAAGVVRLSSADVEGEVYVDLPPARVVGLLGDAAPSGLASEVGWLRFRHALEVTFSGGAALPWVTHVVDGPGQAFRLVRHGLFPGNGALQGTVSVQMAVEEGDPLWKADDGRVVEAARMALGDVAADVSTVGARVQRVANHHPVWVTTTAARMRQLALALGELNITPVGRAGTYAPLSGAGERAYLDDVIHRRVSIREALRQHVEPAVVVDEPRAHLTDFANA